VGGATAPYLVALPVCKSNGTRYFLRRQVIIFRTAQPCTRIAELHGKPGRHNPSGLEREKSPGSNPTSLAKCAAIQSEAQQPSKTALQYVHPKRRWRFQLLSRKRGTNCSGPASKAMAPPKACSESAMRRCVLWLMLALFALVNALEALRYLLPHAPFPVEMDNFFHRGAITTKRPPNNSFHCFVPCLSCAARIPYALERR
jgi:hypothetical protein